MRVAHIIIDILCRRFTAPTDFFTNFFSWLLLLLVSESEVVLILCAHVISLDSYSYDVVLNLI